MVRVLSVLSVRFSSGAYYLPQEPDSAFLYAQILSRDCAPTAPFCELVDKKCIDYGEDVSTQSTTLGFLHLFADLFRYVIHTYYRSTLLKELI